MPKLKEVVASILESLNSAQHKSNLATKQLLQQYKNDEDMKFLMLPNAVMSEVDVALRFMIKGDSSELASSQGGAAKTGIVENLSQNSSTARTFVPTRLAVSHISRTIADQLAENSNLKTLVTDDTRREQIVKKLNYSLQESVAQKKLNSEVSDYALLKEVLVEELNADTLKKKNLSGAELEKETAQNAQIAEAFFNGIGNELKDRVQEASTLLYDAASGMGDLDVVVDGNLLVNENGIQTIHIKANMKNYRCVTTESTGNYEFVLSD